MHAHPNAGELALPAEWRTARDRERDGVLHGNDPLPERRAARALAAFIATGLAFVLLPGTFLGVWNLLSIASHESGTAPQTAWIQAHGQAQLLGWVGTFILGISLYVLPKFLGRSITRFGLVWTVWGIWTIGIAWRWWVGVSGAHWRTGLIASAVLELAAFGLAQFLLWFDKGETAAKKAFPGDLASWLGIAGFASFGVALILNLKISIDVARSSSVPVFPADADRTFLILLLWGFVIPIAWGYSTRFVTVLVGLQKPVQRAAKFLVVCIAAIVACALLNMFFVADVIAFIAAIAAVWALRVLLPSVREPKRIGVYRNYPFFIRSAYLWLLIGAALGVWADLDSALSGLGGASRHALTVGFIATLIFCVAPLILPSFLSGRQLRSTSLMGAALVLLTVGCSLRVITEAIAYGGNGRGVAWSILPFSGVIELLAVTLFVINMGMTMIQPMPAWFSPAGVAAAMPVYFYVASFPKTRKLLIEQGLKTVGVVKEIPKTLTLAEAASADRADIERILASLRDFFAKRQPRRP